LVSFKQANDHRQLWVVQNFPYPRIFTPLNGETKRKVLQGDDSAANFPNILGSFIRIFVDLSRISGENAPASYAYGVKPFWQLLLNHLLIPQNKAHSL